jgi:integrase
MPLTDTELRNAKPKEKPYKLADGGGLVLLVHPNGSKYWRLRYYFLGKEKLLALGVYPKLSAKVARQKAADAKAELAKGIDPSVTRKAESAGHKVKAENTFEVIGREWWDNKRGEWVDHHADRVIGYLIKDVFPALGSYPIVDITPPQLLDVIWRVERRGALDVASRELQFCTSIFRFAIQTGRATFNPAAELSGALKSRKPQHRPSLKINDLPLFFEKLDESPSGPIAKTAVRMTIYTFMRPGEIRTARWQDFDIKNAEWRVPEALMKMKTEHIVPLSRQVLAMLEQLRPFTGHCELLFPGERNRRIPISENTMNAVINRMGYQGLATPHGFRATASSFLNEQGFHRDAIERQLAHMERNKVRSAYTHHAEYLDERRKMMQWWSDYLDGLTSGGNVVPVNFARG